MVDSLEYSILSLFEHYCLIAAKMAEEQTIWSFGFGSNLDRIALENKKHVKVLDESAAILKDWKFSYISGVPFAEPAYANVEVNETVTIHKN